MKHPANLRIWGEKVVLTTYKPEHVAKYNNWMGDEEILRLTGSERLTLDEEYEMQKDWENDPNSKFFDFMTSFCKLCYTTRRSWLA